MRSSITTLKKSCERGSIGTCPRNAIGFNPSSLPTGSMRKASTILGSLPVKSTEATRSGHASISSPNTSSGHEAIKIRAPPRARAAAG